MMHLVSLMLKLLNFDFLQSCCAWTLTACCTVEVRKERPRLAGHIDTVTVSYALRLQASSEQNLGCKIEFLLQALVSGSLLSA